MTAKTRAEQNVVWTRGKGCLELAEILGTGEVNRVQGDLSEGCIEHRADMVVARKMPGDFDMANIAVPVDFDADRVTRVSATVAGGPHSELAVITAAHIARSLDVPLEIVSAHQEPDGLSQATEIVSQFGDRFPDAERRVVQAMDMNELADTAEDGTLIVVGAPGGAWLRRSLFGSGTRIKGAAKAGAVMVRSAPDRVYRFMGDPVYVAPLLHATDTLRLHQENVLAVADKGRLVGLVRRDDLHGAGTAAVASVMADPISARVDDTIEDALPLGDIFGPDPIPVTDHEENLVGGLSLPAA